jgi:glycerol-3-phosphate responsive antiterminator
MIRVDAIREVGIMDEENFIYWDDIDWGYRFKLSNYRVVTYSRSIIWHKMGVAQRTNTFGTYYFWRNRVHFFIKYCTIDSLDKFAMKLFDEIFQSMYSCNYIGKYSSIKTILMAVDDSLNNIRGKALDNRILEIEKIEDKFEKVIKNKSNIIIMNNSEFKVLRNIVNKIKTVNEMAKITITADNIEGLKKQFSEFNISNISSLNNLSEYDLICKTCSHVFEERYSVQNEMVYIDKFFNIISSSDDIKYMKNYDNIYNMLKSIWYPLLLRKIIECNNILNLK